MHLNVTAIINWSWVVESLIGLMLWFQFDYGDGDSQAEVNKLMPKKVKKRRKITTEDGVCIKRSWSVSRIVKWLSYILCSYPVKEGSYCHSMVRMEKLYNLGAFSLFRASGPPRTGAIRVWYGVAPWIRGPLFIPNGSVGRAIPDYFRANQCGRTCVPGNGNHFLLITSREGRLAIQFFHYWLPLFPLQPCAGIWVNIVAKSNKFPFPTIPVWDRKQVNVAR